MGKGSGKLNPETKGGLIREILFKENSTKLSVALLFGQKLLEIIEPVI